MCFGRRAELRGSRRGAGRGGKERAATMASCTMPGAAAVRGRELHGQWQRRRPCLMPAPAVPWRARCSAGRGFDSARRAGGRVSLLRSRGTGGNGACLWKERNKPLAGTA